MVAGDRVFPSKIWPCHVIGSHKGGFFEACACHALTSQQGTFALPRTPATRCLLRTVFSSKVWPRHVRGSHKGGFLRNLRLPRTDIPSGDSRLATYACHALVPPRVAACLALNPQRGLSRQKFAFPSGRANPCHVSFQFTLGRVGPPKPN